MHPNASGASPDELLARIARHADKAAFAALFDAFAPKIKAYMMRRGASDAQADDLIQDVMLTVWTKAAQFDPAKASAATWLFTIARNRRIDVIRREARIDYDGEDPVIVSDPEDGADRLLEGSQEARVVRAAMADLPSDQSAVVALSFFEDKTHVEIADALGLPLGTVKSRIRLAMEKLKVRLGALK